MPKGIPLTQDEIEERRREITVAAVDLILTQGFNETSMREIANAAGIGKSTLYDYFANKDEIILFMVEDPLADLHGPCQSHHPGRWQCGGTLDGG